MNPPRASSDTNVQPNAAHVHERVDVLMRQLDSLLDGEQASARLVACGAAAIAPLRAFLLRGRPRGVYQPRLWAVQALGGLGADDVLVAYLATPPAADPAARFDDWPVRSAAARALTESHDARADDVLFEVARRERLPGALDAVSARDPDRADPLLVAALEEDWARDVAMAALRRRGARVRDLLVRTALEPGNGSARARRRRLAALDLLVEIGIDAHTWDRLSPLVDLDDVEIVCSAARLGAPLSADPARLARRLLELLPRVGWDWIATVEDAAVACILRARADRPFPLLLPLDRDARPDALIAWRHIRARVTSAEAREPD